jgi:hypothetical protein
MLASRTRLLVIVGLLLLFLQPRRRQPWPLSEPLQANHSQAASCLSCRVASLRREANAVAESRRRRRRRAGAAPGSEGVGRAWGGCLCRGGCWDGAAARQSSSCAQGLAEKVEVGDVAVNQACNGGRCARKLGRRDAGQVQQNDAG